MDRLSRGYRAVRRCPEFQVRYSPSAVGASVRTYCPRTAGQPDPLRESAAAIEATAHVAELSASFELDAAGALSVGWRPTIAGLRLQRDAIRCPLARLSHRSTAGLALHRLVDAGNSTVRTGAGPERLNALNQFLVSLRAGFIVVGS